MGDGDFTTFASVTGPRLRRFGVLLCGDRAQAEDLTQEALARVYVRWARLRHDNPEAYARRTMINLQTSWWRSPWSARRAASVPDVASAVDAYASLDDREQVLAALRTLPARMRAVVVLRYWLGLSELETAAELGIAVGSVKSQGSRGLARLRELLAPGDGPGDRVAPRDGPAEGDRVAPRDGPAERDRVARGRADLAEPSRTESA